MILDRSVKLDDETKRWEMVTEELHGPPGYQFVPGEVQREAFRS